MSSSIWNIGTYDKEKIGTETVSYCHVFISGKTEVFNLTKLADVCNTMSANFKDIKDDQIEYEIELDKIETEYNETQNRINTELKETEKRIRILHSKEEKGTITDEETQELEDGMQKFGSLIRKSAEEKSNASNQRNSLTGKIKEQYGAKEILARDYGNAAIEEGAPYANANIEEGDFYERLFKVAMKGRGIAAVSAGEKLIDMLDESQKVNTNLLKQ